MTPRTRPARAPRLTLTELENRAVPASFVVGTVVGGVLTLTGDDQANVFILTDTGADMVVSGGVNTQIQSGPGGAPGAAQPFAGVTAVRLVLKGGNDVVSLDAAATLTLTGAITADMGDGDNTLDLRNGAAGFPATVAGVSYKGLGGIDWLFVGEADHATAVAGNVTFSGGDGDSVVSFENAEVGGNVTHAGLVGDDTLHLQDTTVAKNVGAAFGTDAFTSVVTLSAADVAGNLTVGGARGRVGVTTAGAAGSVVRGATGVTVNGGSYGISELSQSAPLFVTAGGVSLTGTGASSFITGARLLSAKKDVRVSNVSASVFVDTLAARNVVVTGQEGAFLTVDRVTQIAGAVSVSSSRGSATARFDGTEATVAGATTVSGAASAGLTKVSPAFGTFGPVTVTSPFGPASVRFGGAAASLKAAGAAGATVEYTGAEDVSAGAVTATSSRGEATVKLGGATVGAGAVTAAGAVGATVTGAATAATRLGSVAAVSSGGAARVTLGGPTASVVGAVTATAAANAEVSVTVTGASTLGAAAAASSRATAQITFGGTAATVAGPVSAAGAAGALVIDVVSGTTDFEGTVAVSSANGVALFLQNGASALTVGGALTVNGFGAATVKLTSAATKLLENDVRAASARGLAEIRATTGKTTFAGNVTMAGNSTTLTLDATADSSVAKNLTVTGGVGGDTITLKNGFDVLGNATLSLGGASDTAVTLGGAGVVTEVKNLTITAGNGKDAVIIDNFVVNGTASVKTLGGADTVRIDRSTFDLTFALDAGDGDDKLFVARADVNAPTTFAGKATVKLGAGNDTLELGRPDLDLDVAKFEAAGSTIDGGLGYNLHDVTQPADPQLTITLTFTDPTP